MTVTSIIEYKEECVHHDVHLNKIRGNDRSTS